MGRRLLRAGREADRLPNDFMGKYAVHGLLNELKAEDLHVTNTTDGQSVTGVIPCGKFWRALALGD